MTREVAKTYHRLLTSAATTNETSVKTDPGTIRFAQGNNLSASPRYLKFYNKASAPTVGTDTPVLTIRLPGLAAFHINLSAYLSVGIAYAITGALADADTTAIASGDIEAFNLGYE